VNAFDLPGMAAIVGINALLLIADVVAVVGYVRSSWFTDELWQMTRGPQSVSGLLLWALGLSVGAWAGAWQRGTWASWRWQVAITFWCGVLTVVHAIGTVSLWT
jgi:hypothetical protein